MYDKHLERMSVKRFFRADFLSLIKTGEVCYIVSVFLCVIIIKSPGIYFVYSLTVEHSILRVYSLMAIV